MRITHFSVVAILLASASSVFAQSTDASSCTGQSAFGLSFDAPPPQARRVIERMMLGAQVILVEQKPEPEPFYELTVGLSAKSKRIWHIAAKFPVPPGDDWKKTMIALRAKYTESSQVTFPRSPRGDDDIQINEVGQSEHVKVMLTAASTYVLVTCFHKANGQINVDESLH